MYTVILVCYTLSVTKDSYIKYIVRIIGLQLINWLIN